MMKRFSRTSNLKYFTISNSINKSSKILRSLIYPNASQLSVTLCYLWNFEVISPCPLPLLWIDDFDFTALFCIFFF